MRNQKREAQLLQLQKLRCALIFYFETLRKLCCGLNSSKFVALSKTFSIINSILYIELNLGPFRL